MCIRDRDCPGGQGSPRAVGPPDKERDRERERDFKCLFQVN